MPKDRWYAIGNDGGVYIVFRDAYDAWKFIDNNDGTFMPLMIANFGGYENAVCIQPCIGM